MTKKLDIDKFKNYVCNEIGNSLELILLEGSCNSGSWIEGWSDIDLLIAVENLDFNFQKSLPKLSKKLEEKMSVLISLDVVSLEQIKSSEQFLFLNQSKTIQAVYECHLFPSKLIYSKNNNLVLYKPSKEEILFTSLRNVFYFYQEIHKAIQRTYKTDLENLRSLTRRILRHLFNLIKFAVQYKSLQTPQGREEIISSSAAILKNINLEQLKMLSQNIQDWQTISNNPDVLQNLLSEALRCTDTFLQDFLKNDVSHSFGLFENIEK